MSRPRLLDLFSGAGGSAMGYQRAGFEMTGVDIAPQKNYPFRLIQGDALEYVRAHGNEYDAIHASPPCKSHNMIARNVGYAANWPDLLTPAREALRALAIPWVIENVPGAPMRVDLLLCGTQFLLGVTAHDAGWMDLIRHRWFEFAEARVVLRPPCLHSGNSIGVYGHGTNAYHRAKLGRNIRVAEQRTAMGIDWMTRDELAQAIPPACTEFIGAQLIQCLERAA